MPWLSDYFFKCTHLCMCDCCKLNKRCDINSEYFWKQLSSLEKNEDEPFKLLCEKNIYLGESCVMVIGIDPYSEFNVAMRIEKKSIGDFIILNSKDSLSLLECINHKCNC